MSDLEHHIKALHEIREKKREIQDLESETRLKIIELAGRDKQIALGGFELDVSPRTRFKIVDPELVPSFLKSTLPDQQRIDGYFQETGQVPPGVEIQESCVVRVQDCVTPKNTKSDGETGPECHSQVNSISSEHFNSCPDQSEEFCFSKRGCFEFSESYQLGRWAGSIFDEEYDEFGDYEVFIDGTSPAAFGECVCEGIQGERLGTLCCLREGSFAEYGGKVTKDDWTNHRTMCSSCAERRAKELNRFSGRYGEQEIAAMLSVPPMTEDEHKEAIEEIERWKEVEEEEAKHFEEMREQEREQRAREELERKFDGHERPWLD